MTTKKGFTLIELLVVIAIIALLLAIITPALRSAKEIASGSVCMNNQKQLSLAWHSYQGDYKGLLVGGSNYYSGTRSTPYRWVEVPLFKDTDNPGPYPKNPVPNSTQYTLDYRKNGIRAGELYPYSQSESLYHCPGDKGFTKPEPTAEYRSYSISGLMNGEDFLNRDTAVSGDAYIFTPIKAYRSAVTAPGGASRPLRVAERFSDITAPGSKYVFVEEDVVTRVPSQDVNAGGFVLMGGNAFDWWDRPAYFHNDSSTFGFADGHAERHRWGDSDTLRLMKEGRADPEPAKNEDLIWLVRGYLPVSR